MIASNARIKSFSLSNIQKSCHTFLFYTKTCKKMKNPIFNLVTLPAFLYYYAIRRFVIIYGCIYYKLQINSDSIKLLEYLSASLFIKWTVDGTAYKRSLTCRGDQIVLDNLLDNCKIKFGCFIYTRLIITGVQNLFLTNVSLPHLDICLLQFSPFISLLGLCNAVFARSSVPRPRLPFRCLSCPSVDWLIDWFR